jgi:hypothetical protein
VTPILSTHRARTNGWRRVRTDLLSALLAGVAMAFAAPKPAHALSIEATFDPNLSASAVIVINTAISFYQTTFSDPITVNIEFENMNIGLGRSLTFVRTTPYSTYRAALGADATSANDTTALANTPTGAFNPVTGSTFINVKNANLRTVGLPAAFGNFGTACVRVNYVGDSCIGLNVGQTTTGGGAFSLLATVEHEIDEALGLASGTRTTGVRYGRLRYRDGRPRGSSRCRRVLMLATLLTRKELDWFGDGIVILSGAWAPKGKFLAFISTHIKGESL